MDNNSKRSSAQATLSSHSKTQSSRENTPPLSLSSSPAPSVRSLVENRPQTPNQLYSQPRNEDIDNHSLPCEQNYSQGASSRLSNMEIVENNDDLPMISTTTDGASGSAETTATMTTATTTSDRPDSYSYNQPSAWTFYSSSPAHLGSAPSASSTYQGPPVQLTSSLLQPDNDSVYAAVPISSEVHIIPRSSRGFHWNGDLFLKPHQRRSLGVDHIFSLGTPRPASERPYSSSPQSMEQQYDSGMTESTAVNGRRTLEGLSRHSGDLGQDSSVMVHEIRLDDHETAGILPSWP